MQTLVLDKCRFCTAEERSENEEESGIVHPRTEERRGVAVIVHPRTEERRGVRHLGICGVALNLGKVLGLQSLSVTRRIVSRDVKCHATYRSIWHGICIRYL